MNTLEDLKAISAMETRKLHIDRQIGVTMGDPVTLTQLQNCDGTPYWRATRPIGSLFGSPVEGECQGIGRTQEEAIARLEEDQKKLAESIWS